MNTLEYVLSKYELKMAQIVEIPNVGRDDLAGLLHELNFQVGAEIGVERGLYSEVLCDKNPQMKIYGVDPWESFEKSKTNPLLKRTENLRSQDKIEEYYKQACERLSRFPRYKILRDYSVDAAKKFEEESLDFVYIDANHQDPYVLEDITTWSRKVKKGGIVSGHDYYDSHPAKKGPSRVKTIVNEYTKKHKIAPLFIWGLEQNIPGLYRDKWLSWMWIKQ